MVQLNTTFAATDQLSPEFAAKLAQCASQFQSVLSIECGGKRLHLDSLIGILSMELYRGVPVSIIADGPDAVAAAGAVRHLLEGDLGASRLPAGFAFSRWKSRYRRPSSPEWTAFH